MYNKAVRFVGLSLPLLALATGALAFAAFRPVSVPPQVTAGLEEVHLPRTEPETGSKTVPVESLPNVPKPRVALAPKPPCEEFTRVQKLRLTGTTVVGWKVCR